MRLRFDKPSRCYHLAGIGGAGVGALARVLLQLGHRVTGTDVRESPALDALRAAGAEISLRQDGSSIPPDAEAVIASLALDDAHPELAAARRRGVPVVRYPDALGALMHGREGIAIAGTHGKSTTAAWVAFVLDRLGLEPTFVVGGEISQLGGGARAGSGPHVVVEACEYRRAFLALDPRWAIVTNVEAEHLDYYRDAADVVSAFGEFAESIRPDGSLIVCVDSEGARAAAERVRCDVVGYGFSTSADWRAERRRAVAAESGQTFEVFHAGEAVGEFRTRLVGAHNVLNALAVIALCDRLGLQLGAVRETVAEFGGVRRRFEVVGEAGGIVVVDDFAHHPTELAAVLAAARERFGGRRLLAVFQPHQHSRTRVFLDAFAEVLSEFDEAAVAPIYGARDAQVEQTAISAADLAARARCACVGSLDEAVEWAAARLRPGDVFLTLGAGDVWKVAQRLVRRLRGDRAVR